MKLKELLKTIPDDDWLYIGAASGFVFIGQKHEAKKKLREAEKYYFNAYTGYKQDADVRIKNHPQIMEKKQALLAAAKENGSGNICRRMNLEWSEELRRDLDRKLTGWKN